MSTQKNPEVNWYCLQNWSQPYAAEGTGNKQNSHSFTSFENDMCVLVRMPVPMFVFYILASVTEVISA